MWECPCGVENPDSRLRCRGCGVSKERAEQIAAGLPSEAVFPAKSPQERGRARVITGTVITVIGLGFFYWVSLHSPYSATPYLMGGWVFKQGAYEVFITISLLLIGIGVVSIVKGFLDIQALPSRPSSQGQSGFKFCPMCGSRNASSHRFCIECGEELIP